MATNDNTLSTQDCFSVHQQYLFLVIYVDPVQGKREESKVFVFVLILKEALRGS